MLRCSKNIATSQEAIMVDLPRCMAIMTSIRQTWLLNFFRRKYDSQTAERTWLRLQGMGAGKRLTVHAFMITREFTDITKSINPGV